MNRKTTLMAMLALVLSVTSACGGGAAGTAQPTALPPAASAQAPQATAALPAATPVPGGPAVAAGSFWFEVAGAGEDKRIESAVIQDQSTTAEYVIGLVESGALARYAVTLFLPFDVKAGTIELDTLDPAAPQKAPNAAIFIGSAFYYGTGGTLAIDAVDDNGITGSFDFTAQHESDASRTVTVKGAFNQIPLKPRTSAATPATSPRPTATTPVQATPTVAGTTGAPTGVIRQWAASAAAGSQYGDPDWSAQQAAGAPNTPNCGDNSTAWASAGSDSVEWIELAFDVPVTPSEVNIVQSYNPSQVAKVELVDTLSGYHVIYTGEPQAAGQCPYTLSIPVDADYEAAGVRITIDQSALQMGWNEIDAVELVGTGTGTPPAGGATPEPTETPPPPGGFIWRIGGENATADIYAASGMDFGPDGQLYMADSLRRVLVISPDDGDIVATLGEDNLRVASDVKVTADGTIYVADWSSHAVFAFSTDGTLLRQWGTAGTGNGQFGDYSPQYLAACPDGKVYVYDDNKDAAGESYERIQVFSTQGKFVKQWSISALDPIFSLSGMDCGQDGNLYMVGFTGSAVLVVSPDGRLVRQLGEEAVSFSGAHGIAIAPTGELWVSTWNSGALLLDADGNLVGQWGTTTGADGPRPEGVFRYPDAIAVDAAGSIYVGDSGGGHCYLTKFVYQ